MNKNRPTLVFIIPSLLFFLFIKIIPVLITFGYSFTNWNGYQWKADFVGMENYIKLFQDDTTVNSIKTSLLFVLITVSIINILALFFAVVLNESGRYTNLYRSIIFLPVVISNVAIAYVWKVMYSYNGVLDMLFNFIGLAKGHVPWLESPDLALFAVCAVSIWKTVGFHMVILLAFLKTIPVELYEAALIDGCNALQKFKNITLPLLVPGLSISIALSTIGNMKQYDLVSVMTNGGPVNATQILSLQIVNEGFRYSQNGYAAAISFVLFLIILIIVIIQNMALKKKEVEY
jgi:ABC-type sugar transport system permease subunit